MEDKPLLSRKFILAILLVVSISISFWLGSISPDQYMFGLGFAVAVYSGANILEKKWG